MKKTLYGPLAASPFDFAFAESREFQLVGSGPAIAVLLGTDRRAFEFHLGDGPDVRSR